MAVQVFGMYWGVRGALAVRLVPSRFKLCSSLGETAGTIGRVFGRADRENSDLAKFRVQQEPLAIREELLLSLCR